MQDSKFIGLDVHKATISVALAKGERGGETRHWGTIPHRTDHVRKLDTRINARFSRGIRVIGVAAPVEAGYWAASA